MARFLVEPNGVLHGTNRNDTFIVDPNDLSSAVITDGGGAADVLVVYDRPGRTAGEFVVLGDELIWRNYQGDEVRIQLNPDGNSPIEFFEWQRLAEDGTPYTQRNKILLPGDAITEANVSVALTIGADVLTLPTLAAPSDGWMEVYGNAGNDTLTASDNAYSQLYGGRGNDLLLGRGKADDDMTGDNGNDILRGAGGNDYLDGGALNDRIFGGDGKDWIKGGSGDDELSGGRGADAFFFEAGEAGHDTIYGFQANDDWITLNNFDAGDLVITRQGKGSLLTLGAEISIHVENVLPDHLTINFE